MNEKPKQFREEPLGYVAEFLEKPNNVASAGDMTGLMPTPAESAAESESYSDICDLPIQFDKDAPPKANTKNQ